MDHFYTFFLTVFRETSLSTLILFFVAVFCFYTAVRLQSRKDFDFADMLVDDSGKASAVRLGTIVSMIITSWVMIYVTLSKTQGDVITGVFALYIGIWSSAKVAEKAIDAWSAKPNVGAPAAPASQRAYTPTGAGSAYGAPLAPAAYNAPPTRGESIRDDGRFPPTNFGPPTR